MTRSALSFSVHSGAIGIFLLIGVMWLSGCAQTQPTRFHLLRPLASPLAVAPLTRTIRLAVGPVQVADYLRRPQLVAAEGRFGLRVGEFDQWGGNLEQGVASVLAENLSLLLGQDAIFLSPGEPAVSIGYRLVVEIRRFEPDGTGTFQAVIVWTLLPGDSSTPLKIRRMMATEPLADGSFSTLVEAQSRALALLAHEVAETLVVFEHDQVTPSRGTQ